MDFSFGQLVIGIVAVMVDFTVIVLFLDQVAQRVVAVTGALVLGKAVANDSAAFGLVVGTDEVADSVVLVTATDKDGRVCFVVAVRLGDLLFQTA